MLWISLGRDNALADEVARQSGLKAVIAAADTPEWKKRDTRRCRVIVIELPASSAFVQEVMTAAQDALRPVPVVILDREGSLDESLIGPSLSLFQHLVGDRSAEEISEFEIDDGDTAHDEDSAEDEREINRLLQEDCP